MKQKQIENFQENKKEKKKNTKKRKITKGIRNYQMKCFLRKQEKKGKLIKEEE